MLLCSDKFQIQCTTNEVKQFLESLCGDIEKFWVVGDGGQILVPRIELEKQKECSV